MAALILARLVALAHLGFIVFLVAGGPLGRRFRRVVPVHLAAIAVTVAINLSGSDCPLTAWERALLRAGGDTPYASGFVSHYLVEPFRPAGVDGHVNLVLLAAWIVPTAGAYLSLRGSPAAGARSARRLSTLAAVSMARCRGTQALVPTDDDAADRRPEPDHGVPPPDDPDSPGEALVDEEEGESLADMPEPNEPG